MSREPVTEEDVCEAADRLLRARKKPTVDAVRVELGDRGSMTTITRHLQTWWEHLSDRLDAMHARPEVPAAIADGLARLWDTAVDEARHALRHENDVTQRAAAEAIAAADARTAAAEQAVEVAQSNLAAASHAATALQARLDALQREYAALAARLASAQGEASVLREERERLLAEVVTHRNAAQVAAEATAKAIADLRDVQSTVETKARIALDAERSAAAAKVRGLTKDIQALQEALATRDSRLLEAAKQIARLSALTDKGQPSKRGGLSGAQRGVRRGR